MFLGKEPSSSHLNLNFKLNAQNSESLYYKLSILYQVLAKVGSMQMDLQ